MTMAIAKNPHGVVLENVWGRPVSAFRDDVLSFWKRHGGPVGDVAEQRLKQLVYVVRNESGAVVGASTAFKGYVKQLRNHFFIFRLMIAPESRIPGLTSRLLVSTREYLELIHQQEGQDIPIGLLTVVQNEKLKKFRNEAIWPASKMVYIGNTPEGHHIRVYYFKGARIR